MDRDGKNKHDLTKDSKEFAYGFSASKDGRRIAYHKSYQVYVADADGSNARKIPTGHPFNFAPQWSPDGTHLLFVAGEHDNCHPYVANADGTGLRKLADRGGYRGRDRVPRRPRLPRRQQRHPGLVDRTAPSVYYTAQVGANVELFRVSLDGRSERLTRTPAGSLHYHPTPSPDGRYLAYGSQRDGVRQLYVLRLADRSERRLTDLPAGPRGHVAALATHTRRITAHRAAKLPATTVLTSVGYVVQTDLVAKSIGDGGRPVQRRIPPFPRDVPVQDCDAPLRAPPAVRLADRVPRGRDAVRTVPARAAGLIAPDRPGHPVASP